MDEKRPELSAEAQEFVSAKDRKTRIEILAKTLMPGRNRHQRRAAKHNVKKMFRGLDI